MAIKTPEPKKKRLDIVQDDEETATVPMEEEEDVETEDEMDLDSEESDSESDDSIIVPDDELEKEEGQIPEDEDNEENAKKMAEILKQEAERFLKSSIDATSTRMSLRDRTKIKKPDDSHLKLIQNAFIQDEKKELIKELNIWKRTFLEEVAQKGIVFPKLTLSMSLEHIKQEHDIIREKLGLESTDDEEDDDELSDDEEEDDETETIDDEEEDDDDIDLDDDEDEDDESEEDE